MTEDHTVTLAVSTYRAVLNAERLANRRRRILGKTIRNLDTEQMAKYVALTNKLAEEYAAVEIREQEAHEKIYGL